MFPQGAGVMANPVDVAPGTPALWPTRSFAPNPNHASRFQNWNWANKEKEQYYQLSRSMMPWEYSHHETPMFYDGGNQISQYMPPTGYNRPGNTAYSLPGVSPGMIRPTFAYNRVLGRGVPTMYVAGFSGWPNQYYPGSSNTYIPSWEATGLILKYTRSPSFFRVNRYVKELNVDKDQGYYLTLSGDDPYRVVNVNDFLWKEDADAPGGRQNRQAFGYQPYRTARYCFPFNLGKKGVSQAPWPILAEHGAMSASLSMTVRTLIATGLLTTAANWNGSWGNNSSAASGTWSTSTTTTRLIQGDINTALIQVELGTGGIVCDEDALQGTCNPVLARLIGRSPEYAAYIQGSPDALSALTDWRNPNRKYSLAPYLYGLRLAVENAVVVTTPKSANVTSPGTQVRSYVWPSTHFVITSKPTGIVSEDEQTLDFSTIAFRFFEQMTTEQKSDPDNRREVGRVVEDYTCILQAPQTGYDITTIS